MKVHAKSIQSFSAVMLAALLAQPAWSEPSPSVEDAQAFVAAAERELEETGQYAERMNWVYQTYITEDTARLSASAQEAFTGAQVRLAGESVRFSKVPGLDGVTRRKLHMLRSGIVVPAPSDAAKIAEQAQIGARLRGMYGSGEYCDRAGACRDLQQLNDVMFHSRDADELLRAWSGWRTVARDMRPLYARQVELANEGARELGFDDLGSMWRSSYDMPPDDLPAELDRLWGQARPLYEALHCHVRARLGEHYGIDRVPAEGPIPAHLLGNMWAQQWRNIYDLVAPGAEVATHDLDEILVDHGFDAVGMVKTGEAFFTSLGFEKLPVTFWERSIFIQPSDRKMVCHPSAWNIDEKEDLRIKMCIRINADDFNTIHHELGHNFYYRAYNQQPYLFRYSANGGFHEAVGDAVALSITPQYLQEIGLLEKQPAASGDIGLLLRSALDKVAFLPFGLLVDQWRWKVFAGDVGPDGYNSLWWDLRHRYQGVAEPDQRPADAFDPGAKYHVPDNTPYTRYFLAHILQFQFHRALCELTGQAGPMHRCSIYGSKAAGERLQAMLQMGRSRPWQDALEAMTGSREMDATAMLDYYAPLKDWLDEQNEGRSCGW